MGRSLSGSKLARLVALLVTGVLTVMLVGWIIEDPVANVTTDWTAFDNAGDRLLAGETVYRPFSFEDEPLPYLYPPFALWLSIPLAAFDFWGSFFLSTLIPFSAYLAGLWLFGRSETAKIDRTDGVIIAIASGMALSSTLIGQYSGFYVLAFGAGAKLYQRDRHLAAGLVLALLWLKPNIAIVVPVALLWARSWRSLGGFSAGTAGMLALSLPFGLEQWTGFFANVRNMAELQEQGLVPIDKMITVLSSVQTTFGLEDQIPLSIGIWLGATAVLGVAVLSLWTQDQLESSPARAFGALAIFAVAANPRLYFYDGLLAAIGMFGLWMHALAHGGATTKRWTPVLAGVLWIGSWGAVWPLLNVLVGPAIGAALVVAALDARSKSEISTVSNGNFEESEDSTPAQLAA